MKKTIYLLRAAEIYVTILTGTFVALRAETKCDGSSDRCNAGHYFHRTVDG